MWLIYVDIAYCMLQYFTLRLSAVPSVASLTLLYSTRAVRFYARAKFLRLNVNSGNCSLVSPSRVARILFGVPHPREAPPHLGAVRSFPPGRMALLPLCGMALALSLVMVVEGQAR